MSTSIASTAETQAALPTGTWTVDPVHSQVEFAVDYHVGTFRGTFAPIDATLEVGEDGAVRLSGSVAVAGVSVRDPNLSAHLQSPEFFDAERTPQITFRSTEISQRGAELEVRGELNIRGTALPVTVTGRVGERKDYMERPYFGLKLATTIDRTRFGLNWNNTLPSGEPALANDVQVQADLFLVKS